MDKQKIYGAILESIYMPLIFLTWCGISLVLEIIFLVANLRFEEWGRVIFGAILIAILTAATVLHIILYKKANQKRKDSKIFFLIIRPKCGCKDTINPFEQLVLVEKIGEMISKINLKAKIMAATRNERLSLTCGCGKQKYTLYPGMYELCSCMLERCDPEIIRASRECRNA